MTLEQCKYLTEQVLGECFHDYDKYYKSGLKCTDCGSFLHNRTFDNWTDFGALWSVMQKHEKWEEFLRHHSVGGFYYKQIDVHYVHETRFAEAVYNFFKEQDDE